MKTLEEAIEYCESHECEECILFNGHHYDDCRTKYEKIVLHIPCFINLLDEDCLTIERMKWNEHL